MLQPTVYVEEEEENPGIVFRHFRLCLSSFFARRLRYVRGRVIETDESRETGNGSWETGYRRRETRDGRREMVDGRREMGDGRRETGDVR